MLFGFAALERTTHHTQTAGASQTPFYPDDLLPELKTTLAILADLEVSFEIARDSLEEWSGRRRTSNVVVPSSSRLTGTPVSRTFSGSKGCRSRSEGCTRLRRSGQDRSDRRVVVGSLNAFIQNIRALIQTATACFVSSNSISVIWRSNSGHPLPAAPQGFEADQSFVQVGGHIVVSGAAARRRGRPTRSRAITERNRVDAE